MYNPFLISIAVTRLARRRHVSRWHNFAVALRELANRLIMAW